MCENRSVVFSGLVMSTLFLSSGIVLAGLSMACGIHELIQRNDRKRDALRLLKVSRGKFYSVNALMELAVKRKSIMNDKGLDPSLAKCSIVFAITAPKLAKLTGVMSALMNMAEESFKAKDYAATMYHLTEHKVSATSPKVIENTSGTLGRVIADYPDQNYQSAINSLVKYSAEIKGAIAEFDEKSNKIKAFSLDSGRQSISENATSLRVMAKGLKKPVFSLHNANRFETDPYLSFVEDHIAEIESLWRDKVMTSFCEGRVYDSAVSFDEIKEKFSAMRGDIIRLFDLKIKTEKYLIQSITAISDGLHLAELAKDAGLNPAGINMLKEGIGANRVNYNRVIGLYRIGDMGYVGSLLDRPIQFLEDLRTLNEIFRKDLKKAEVS